MELKDETSFHGGEGEGKDVSIGIERLPDEVLCHILSFLETKYAVRTSLLSKRCRYLWTSVPCIDILCPNGKQPFIDFLDRVLHLNTVPCFRKLHLAWGINYNRLHEWISTAMERDIEEIDLDFWAQQQYVKLPPRTFTLKKLVILKLYGICSFVPSSVYLPSLKILHLYFGKNFYVDWMKNLRDGCPVLEELEIKDIPDDNVKTLFVSSPSLKLLRIDYPCLKDLRIVVDVPNVEKLDLIDNVRTQYDISSLYSLVKANIYIRKSSSSNRLVEYLGKFTNTWYMHISSTTKKGLDYQGLDHLPLFHNLTHLKVCLSDPSRPVLPYLLKCSPNLVTFVSCECEKVRSRLQFKAPKCLMLYLEEIELREFRGLMYEMGMVRYFLKNSPVLKLLSIQSDAGAKKKGAISKKLLTFARGSPACEIIFD